MNSIYKALSMYYISMLGFIFIAEPVSAKSIVISTTSEALLYPKIEALIIKAYQKLGHEASIVRMPAERALLEASKAIWVDAELIRVKDAELQLEKFIRIPVVIHSLDIVGYSPHANLEISNWQSLKNYRIATIRGYIGPTKMLDKHKLKYIKTTSLEQAIKLAKSNRVDIVVLLSGMLDSKNSESSSTDIPLYETKLGSITLYHYIHQSHKDMVPQLTKILSKLVEENFSKR